MIKVIRSKRVSDYTISFIPNLHTRITEIFESSSLPNWLKEKKGVSSIIFSTANIYSGSKNSLVPFYLYHQYD
jgi:hypothetical protein